jgi:hypothetical protein
VAALLGGDDTRFTAPLRTQLRGRSSRSSHHASISSSVRPFPRKQFTEKVSWLPAMP